MFQKAIVNMIEANFKNIKSQKKIETLRKEISYINNQKEILELKNTINKI
jgi:hypothetical protein